VQRTITAITAFKLPGSERALAWIEAERGRFIPWLPVWMGVGVLAYFAQTTEPPAWAGAAVSAAAALVTLAARRRIVARAVTLCALFAALGFCSAQMATWRALPIDLLPRNATMLAGVVRSVEALPEGRRVTLDQVQLPGQELARRIRVKLKAGDQTALAAGDLVRLRAMLRPPAGPTYPGAWDLQRDAFFNGLGAYGTALGVVEVLEQAPPEGTAWVQALRDGVARRVMAGVPGPAGAVAATLLTGGTAAIPATDRSAFRDSGLAHLLAVAGLHIGIVMGLVMAATRYGLALSERAALFWPCKAIAAGAALRGAGYLLLTGAHLPILRSFAMACLVTLGVMLGRRALSLRGLALAALVLMVLSPHEVVGVSFQMSFSAVLALIAGYEALRPVLMRLYHRRILSHVVALVLTSLLAGSASAAYGAYHFGHFQLYFILSNVAAVPMTAFWVLPWGLAALALMPLGLEHVALVPMGWGVEGLLWIARTVAALPEATMPVPHLATWGLAVFSLGLAWLGIWRSRARLLGVPVMALGLLSPVVTPPPDVLMSPDARVIAFKSGPYWLQAHGRAPFVTDSWQNYLARPLEPIRAGLPPECAGNACRFDTPAGPVLLMRDKGRADCAGVVLLISAEPGRDVCPRGVRYLDRFSVWRDGAIAVWLTAQGAVVLTDRQFRGDRPWVPPPPVARAHIPHLPMAPSEELPDEPDPPVSRPELRTSE